ncbi:MAG: hypothetical protein ACK5RJ_09425 [Burkholderiales bacterium]
MMLTAPHRALALRAFVVLPGALVEGALAVALPWLVTRASLGTPWLGVLPALLVAAALVGALAAPFAAKYFGSRRVVLGGALLAATGLGIATTLLLLGFTAAAFGVALTVIAADGLADVTFNARTPFMARLSRVPLQQFTSANWLWSVGGVALGGAMAGVAISDEMRPTSAITWLAASMAVLAFLVALALTVLMPRDSRISHGVAGERPNAPKRDPRNPRILLLFALIAGLSFLYGPVDNLLAPARLASNGRDASTFGALAAVGAMGLAMGLMLTHAVCTDRYGKTLLLVGLAGIVAQIALLWWLPRDPALVLGSFVTAAVAAPLLPLLQSSALKAVASTHRTAMLAAAVTTVSLADLVGTAVFGALAGAVGTGCALGVATVLAVLGFAVALPIASKVVSPQTTSNPSS